jgi:N-acetylmuramoyl-L-alanine amidase
LNVRQHGLLRLSLAFSAIALPLLWFITGDLAGQSPVAQFVVIAREARQPVPVATIAGQEFVALDDLASTFRATVREESGALTLSYQGRTIVVTPDQTLASVAGRVTSLSAPPTRLGGRWQVPVDFISRALPGIYDARIELRRASHLIVVGDLRVPRLTIRQESAGPGGRVMIDIMPRAGVTVAQDGQRLTVRFDADALDVTYPGTQLPGLVQGFHRMDATAMAVDLGPGIAFRSSTRIADASSVLLIDLFPAPAGTTALPPAPEPALPSSAPERPPLEMSGAGFRTIVIDPGHGGADAGVSAANGTLEKDITLAMARRLKAAIEARLGVRVLMTRDSDQSVGMSDRPALANNNKADLFVSLHANASPRPAASGATIYVASFPEGTVDPEILSPERLPAVGGGVRDIELVPWNLAQVRHRDESELFASLLADELHGHISLARTPVDRAPLRVLESANMPAVLIEAGFLSNPEQAALLASARYQSTLAQQVLEAITRFWNPAGTVEGAVR